MWKVNLNMLRHATKNIYTILNIFMLLDKFCLIVNENVLLLYFLLQFRHWWASHSWRGGTGGSRVFCLFGQCHGQKWGNRHKCENWDQQGTISIQHTKMVWWSREISTSTKVSLFNSNVKLYCGMEQKHGGQPRHLWKRSKPSSISMHVISTAQRLSAVRPYGQECSKLQQKRASDKGYDEGLAIALAIKATEHLAVGAWKGH